ncbi:MAG: non-homologous end-joining DNA ligase [Terriglobales bacterium]
MPRAAIASPPAHPHARLGQLDLPRATDQALLVVDETPVNLTHLGKVLIPATAATPAITKRDLLDYNRDVSPFLLPHMRDRPYTMKRFPDGIAAPPFFQKEARAPAWVKTARMPSQNQREHINYALCNDLPTLLYLVNAGCIDHNIWMSRAASPLEPDFVLLDLDPGPAAPFRAVVRVAQALRALLDEFEITAFTKTSGATGMHIWIPIAPGYSFQQTQQFAALLLRMAAARLPDLVTEDWNLEHRPKDRVYLDFRQNAHGKTIPPPYSPRPRSGAPVSTPLRWSELTLRLDPARFNLTAVRRRLDRFGDLFAGCLPSIRHESLRSMLRRIQNRRQNSSTRA